MLNDNTQQMDDLQGVVSVVNDAIKSELKDTKKWRHSQICITDNIPEAQPMIMQGDRIALSRGGILVMQGKAKAFKSFAVSGIVSAIEDDCLGFTMTEGVEKILYIDTEQASSHVKKVLIRIYRLCGWSQEHDNEKITMLAIREFNASERLEVIKEAINDLRPDIVVIDGIRDLLADFNDVKESSRIINELMIITTTYNCGIITVIHTNKADNNARGHLGSELYNKAETVLQVANKDGTASVKPHHSRNIEIEPFSFRVVDGLPTLCDYVPCQELNDKRATMLQELFSVILSKVGWMEREKLTSTIVAMKKKDKRTAQRYISDGLKVGIIKLNRANNIVLSIKEEVEEEDDDDMLF